MTGSPRVIAHRGASAAYPENTLAAFEGARHLGADWVELDVRPTADGALAIHHDVELPDGRLIPEVRVADLPSEVPLLDAALDACGGMGVNVEVKHDPREVGFDEDRRLGDLVVAALRARPSGQDLSLSCFDLAMVDRLRELGDWPTAWLVYLLDSATVDECVAHGHPAINPLALMIDADGVAAAKARGLEVSPFTVDDPDRMVELASWGVDGIFTNVPDVARRVFDGLR